MYPEHCSLMPVLICQLLLMASLRIVGTSSSADTRAVLTVSETKSSSSDSFTSSRHKRAPGWGKRAPGWGKRNTDREELLDESESDLEDIKNSAALKELLSQGEHISSNKRAPGWGKRAPGWGKRAPGWGKRSCYAGPCFNRASTSSKVFPSVDKTVNDDLQLNDESDGTGQIRTVLFKRAPGWGKRKYEFQLDSGDDSDEGRRENIQTELLGRHNIKEILDRISSLSKGRLLSDDISPGKRAPGWGKRNHDIDFTYEGTETDKRAPGWGKRAPGWGKRSYQVELDDESEDNEKRAPGWGKRAPGWGKRSVADRCQELQNMKGDYAGKVVEAVSGKCGEMSDGNKSSRK